MSNGFYRYFEESFYSSEEQVKKNRQIYMPFVKEFVKEDAPAPLVVDIGCGRGEWLQMLSEIGFAAKGSDIDAGMMASAIEKQLDVSLVDGLELLKSLPDESVSVVTAFHVLEHMDFAQIQDFFVQAKRLLVPGGIVIAETPNFENLHVATTNFWLDHTHLRPIPILQMINLVRYHGFETYSVLRVQEDKTLYHDKTVTLRDLYYGVSKDYAILAQKEGSDEFKQALSGHFKYESGIGIDEVIKRYDSQFLELQEKLKQMESFLETIKESMHPRQN